jgi:hypothetical protein
VGVAGGPNATYVRLVARGIDVVVEEVEVVLVPWPGIEVVVVEVVV